MLVVVITLLAALVAVPSFVRSLRGARLRSSLRTVAMVHRYARSLSVLQQKHAALVFDTEKNTIEVVVVALQGGVDDRGRFLEDRANPDTPLSASVESEAVRSLQLGVRIASFRGQKAGQEKDGVYFAQYYPNGMCDGYQLTLADERNQQVDVRVEAHSGRMTLKEN